jgi:polysaccharide deacetylase 2 family uncharacterized protein YibQ
MASKSSRPKRTRRKKRTGFVLSFFLGVLLALLGYSYFSHRAGEGPHRRGTPPRKVSPADQSKQGSPQDSGISKKDAILPPSSLKEEGEPSAPKTPAGPKIAIVIDDLGGENHISGELLRFDFPVTFSILPFAAHSRSLAIEAPQKGKEVILHLPMEPHGYPKVNPGPGALLEEMSDERLLQQLTEDIESVPNIRGVSNHMGSRLMEDPEKLKIILSDLKRRGLFFLDSRTTSRTVGLQTARFVGLKAMERTLFIDNSLDEGAIKGNLDHLIQSSLSTGMAIGIGHPHWATVNAIREMIPKMKEKGIELVPLSLVMND